MGDLILLSNNEPMLSDEIKEQILAVETALKSLEETKKDIRDKLMAEMTDKGIIKLENDLISITYKDSYDRENFDKKQFKKDHPDMYDEYISMSTIAPSLMIKLK